MNSKKRFHVTLIEDDSAILEILNTYFKQNGFLTHCFSSTEEALVELEIKKTETDLIISDLHFANLGGIELISKLKKQIPNIPIIIISGDDGLDVALDLKQKGAFEFFLKPIHLPQLLHSARVAIKFKNELSQKDFSGSDHGHEGLIGQSDLFLKALSSAKRIAGFSSNVLIAGESGTGKELFAKTIHNISNRQGAFLAINCSAIPENLLEAELFGHSKGAFTGAIEKRIGLFEEANNGTLFLDEIGDLALPLQAKLLRVLQERKIKRIGENIYRDFSARIVCATHKNLKAEVKEGRFREDLYYRLNVIQINIPSLREREDDLLLLSEYFLDKFCRLNNIPIKKISKNAIQHILSYSWPGNIRELENSIERAVILSKDEEINPEDIIENDISESPSKLENKANLFLNILTLKEKNLSLDEISKQYIKLILNKNLGAKEQTAKELGIDRKTLYRKLKEIESSNLQ